MTIESKIESLTAAVVKLCAILESHVVTDVSVPVTVTAPIAAVAAAPITAPAAAAPEMPPLPSFATPAAAQQVGTAPFSDAKGLIAYVMDAYKAMGPEKGQKIQGVLIGLGYQNINDVKPEHYGALYASIEALKVV